MRRRITIGMVAVLGLGAVSAMAGNVNSKFDIDLYGYIKAESAYDTQRTVDGDIMLWVMPLNADGSKNHEFNMTSMESRFGFNIKGPDAGTAKTSGKIETDFYGRVNDKDHSGWDGRPPAQKPLLRLRLAYADLNYDTVAWRFGQDWDTFMTLVPRDMNFTYFGEQGAPGYRRTQVRVTKAIGSGDTKLKVMLAAARTLGYEDPATDANGEDDGVASGVPTLEANLILETKLLGDKPSKFSISGEYGMETCDRLATNVVKGVAQYGATKPQGYNFNSWLAMVSVYLPLANKLAVQGAYWQGANVDAYEAGILEGVNIFLNKPIAAQGGWAQIMVNPDGQLNWNLGVGLDDPKDGDLTNYPAGAAGPRLKNDYYMSNLYYKLNAALTFGFEYSHLKTTYTTASANDDRFQGAVYYYF